MKCYKVNHFADDTDLINLQTSVKIIYKQINHDLKNLSDWSNTDKFYLNVSETKLVMFNPLKK